MFENDYTINGKHATYLKDLKDNGVFERYIDVYMVSVVIGFLNGRRSFKDSTSQDRARIYADAFATERLKCVFLFRLIMLLDDSRNLSDMEKIDNSFRFDAGDNRDINTKNLDLFNSYSLGGIEILYENLLAGGINKDDYIDKAYEYVNNFEDEIKGISYEEKLLELITGRV